MKKISAVIISVVLIAAFAFACGCTGTDTKEEKITDLRIGYQPSTHQVAHMTAMEKGWWMEDLAPYGVEKISETEFPTGAPEMQAMLAKQLDIAYVGAAPVISAIANGLDAKIVAAVQTQGSDLVLRSDIEYTGPEDLKGLTLATFPEGTIQDTLLRTWLMNNGIDPETDVVIKLMGPGEAITAITAGQVDGVFLPHPAPTILEIEGTGKTVMQSGEIEKNHACCVLVASGELIRDHPKLLEQIIKTHIKATEYNINHEDEAATIYATKTKWDVETIKKSLNDWDGSWISDPEIIKSSVMDYTKTQAKLGYISKPLTEDEIFDFSFYKTATA